jgi:hypothetical protein
MRALQPCPLHWGQPPQPRRAVARARTIQEPPPFLAVRQPRCDFRRLAPAIWVNGDAPLAESMPLDGSLECGGGAVQGAVPLADGVGAPTSTTPWASSPQTSRAAAARKVRRREVHAPVRQRSLPIHRFNRQGMPPSFSLELGCRSRAGLGPVVQPSMCHPAGIANNAHGYHTPVSSFHGLPPYLVLRPTTDDKHGHSVSCSETVECACTATRSAHQTMEQVWSSCSDDRGVTAVSVGHTRTNRASYVRSSYLARLS